VRRLACYAAALVLTGCGPVAPTGIDRVPSTDPGPVFLYEPTSQNPAAVLPSRGQASRLVFLDETDRVTTILTASL
jgi:hypothetical protein